MSVPRSHIPLSPWRQPPPPPPAEELGLVASLRPGPRFSCWIGHSHLFRPQPFPGAPAFAYEALGLVEFSPIGWGVANRDHLLPLEPPTAFSTWGLRTQGVGGLSTGQWVTAPLIVEPDQLGEPFTADVPENWVG